MTSPPGYQDLGIQLSLRNLGRMGKIKLQSPEFRYRHAGHGNAHVTKFA